MDFVNRDALWFAVSGAGRRENQSLHTSFLQRIQQRDSLFDVVLEIPRRFGHRFTYISEGREMNAGFDFVVARDASDEFAIADVTLIKRHVGWNCRPVPAR